jgi:hypothetical protein
MNTAWATSIQFMPHHHVILRYIIIFYNCLPLGLPTDFFPSGFHTNSHLHPPPWLHHFNYTCRRVQVMTLLIMLFLGTKWRPFDSEVNSTGNLFVLSSWKSVNGSQAVRMKYNVGTQRMTWNHTRHRHRLYWLKYFIAYLRGPREIWVLQISSREYLSELLSVIIMSLVVALL